MGMLLRLGSVGFLVSSLTILMGLVAGYFVETDTITRYHIREDTTYTISIQDTVRDLHLRLAGTRCYNPLPPWFSEEEEAGGVGSVYQQMNVYVRLLIDDLPAIAIAHLRCP